MPATYVHLSGRNVDDALLRMYGLQESGDDEHTICPRCKSSNDPVSRYCGKCGLPFGLDIVLQSEQERDKYDGLMSKLIEDKDVQEAILKAVGKIGIP